MSLAKCLSPALLTRPRVIVEVIGVERVILFENVCLLQSSRAPLL
jgi:hypothetical protein